MRSSLLACALLLSASAGWSEGIAASERPGALAQAQAAARIPGRGSLESLKSGGDRIDGAAVSAPLAVPGKLSSSAAADARTDNGAKTDLPLNVPSPAAVKAAASGAGVVGFIAGFLAVESVSLAAMSFPYVGWVIGAPLFIALLPAALLAGCVNALLGL